MTGPSFAGPSFAAPDFATPDFAAPDFAAHSLADLARAPNPDLRPDPGRFAAFGLVFDSDLVAPWMEPAPADVTADVPADVTVRLAPIPDTAEDAPWAGVWRVVAPGVLVFDAPNIRMRLIDGRRIELDLDRPAPASRETALLTLAYGAMPALLHQRGALPMHAAAAAGPMGAALFVGDAGAGKSTFAAMLAGAGWALAGDDLIALDLAPDRPIGVHRAMRTARLFEDSTRALDRFGANGAPLGAAVSGAGEGVSKEVRALADGPGVRWPAPLRAVFALEWLHPDDAAPELERIGGMRALMLLRAAVGRPEIAAALGQDAAYFALLGRVAAQAPVYVLRRPRRFDAAPAAAALARAAIEEASATDAKKGSFA